MGLDREGQTHRVPGGRVRVLSDDEDLDGGERVSEDAQHVVARRENGAGGCVGEELGVETVDGLGDGCERLGPVRSDVVEQVAAVGRGVGAGCVCHLESLADRPGSAHAGAAGALRRTNDTGVIRAYDRTR